MKQLIKLFNQLITWLKNIFSSKKEPFITQDVLEAMKKFKHQHQRKQAFLVTGYNPNKAYKKVPSIEYRDYKVLIAAYGYKPHQFSFKDYLQYKNIRGPYQTHLRTY